MKKVLFLSANPKGTAPLAIDKEIKGIQESIQLADVRSLDLVYKPAVRDIDIRRALLNENPFIIHFSGHGDNSGIIIESEKGTYRVISPKALTQLISAFSDTIKCVVLNACYTENQAVALSEYIPYVIGSNAKIEDSVARSFSIAFYDALNAGRTISYAFNYGKKSLLLTDPSKTDMLIMKISALEQQLIEKKEALKKAKQEYKVTKTKIQQENHLQDIEKKLLARCAFPEITKWLIERKEILSEKVQQTVLSSKKELDLEIFRGEFRRHLELIITSLLTDNENHLDEPALRKSFNTDYYKDGLSLIKKRLPENRFSRNAYEKVIDNIDYLKSRL